MIDFAKKLKGLRESREWSQDELAKRLEVSRSTIGNYEQGTREPDFETLEKIADVFNCPISFLMDDTRQAEQIRNYYMNGSHSELTNEESDVIEAYRNLTDKEKTLICNALGIKRGDTDLPSLQVANDR